MPLVDRRLCSPRSTGPNTSRLCFPYIVSLTTPNSFALRHLSPECCSPLPPDLFEVSRPPSLVLYTLNSLETSALISRIWYMSKTWVCFPPKCLVIHIPIAAISLALPLSLSNRCSPVHVIIDDVTLAPQPVLSPPRGVGMFDRRDEGRAGSGKNTHKVERISQSSTCACYASFLGLHNANGER